MKVVEKYGRPLWVIGSPITHTLSPPIHNAAFRSAGFPHRYFALEVSPDELEDFLSSFRALDGLGANLTLPLKEKCRDYVDRETKAVKATEAANTLFWEQGDLALDNTDVYGFKQLIEPWSNRVSSEATLVLGAGGAARACLQGLNEMDCDKVYLWNRTTSKAESLQRLFESINVEVLSDSEFKNFTSPVALVINATSLGLDESDPSPFPTENILETMVGVDLIYGRDTAFIQDFRDHGKDAVDGMAMLINQAARAWERWIGKEPDLEAMQKAVAAHD